MVCVGIWLMRIAKVMRKCLHYVVCLFQNVTKWEWLPDIKIFPFKTQQPNFALAFRSGAHWDQVVSKGSYLQNGA